MAGWCVKLLPISAGVARLAETAGEAVFTQHCSPREAFWPCFPSIAIFILLQKFIVQIIIGGTVDLDTCVEPLFCKVLARRS